MQIQQCNIHMLLNGNTLQTFLFSFSVFFQLILCILYLLFICKYLPTLFLAVNHDVLYYIVQCAYSVYYMYMKTSNIHKVLVHIIYAVFSITQKLDISWLLKAGTASPHAAPSVQQVQYTHFTLASYCTCIVRCTTVNGY